MASLIGSAACAAQGVFLTVGGGLRDIEVDNNSPVVNGVSSDQNMVTEFGVGYLFSTNVVLEGSTTDGVSTSGLFRFSSYEFEDDRVMVGYAFPVAERFRIVPAVGASFWDLRVSDTFFQPSVDQTLSGTDWVWRLVGEFLVGETFGIYFGYTRSEFDVGSTSLFSIGMRVQF